jgi:hypothetical protein
MTKDVNQQCLLTIFMKSINKNLSWVYFYLESSFQQMASSIAVSATSPLGPAGSNSTTVLTNTTPGTGSVLSLPVGKNSDINMILEYVCVCMWTKLVLFTQLQSNQRFHSSAQAEIFVLSVTTHDNIPGYYCFMVLISFICSRNFGYRYREMHRRVNIIFVS